MMHIVDTGLPVGKVELLEGEHYCPIHGKEDCLIFCGFNSEAVRFNDTHFCRLVTAWREKHE